MLSIIYNSVGFWDIPKIIALSPPFIGCCYVTAGGFIMTIENCLLPLLFRAADGLFSLQTPELRVSISGHLAWG